MSETVNDFREDTGAAEENNDSIFNKNYLKIKHREGFESVIESANKYKNGERTTVTAFLVDGVGGSGKTFLYETILSSLKQFNHKSITVAV